MNTKYKISVLLLSMFFSLISCETLDLDVNTDPNNASPDSSDINLLLNGAMLDFSKWISEEDGDNRIGFQAGMKVVRMMHMYGPLYENAWEPGDFDDVWRQAYAGHLIDIKTVKASATEAGLSHHVGIAQILESYTMTTLVDYFGDVPYSEAGLGAENFNPNVDDDEVVYATALSLLDDAISNLNSSATASIQTDLFYDGDLDKWITLAKTLKLRIYNNTRLVDSGALAGINALLADGDLMDDEDEDFSVFFGAQASAPDIRHPQFVDNYELAPSGEYMSMYFMNLMVNGFNEVDPRTRYYFYRQVGEYPENNAQGVFDFPCLAEPYPLHYTPGVDPFCTSIGDGYWGRIHGDAQGLPSDSNKITTWGTYPIGGRFDDDAFSAASRTDGMGGAGILPIMQSSFVYFMRAEAALTLGTSDNASAMLEAGMRASFDKVINFNPSIAGNAYESTQGDVDDYVDDIMADYGAADATGKLDIVMKQAYIASWGNPVEAYNNYRRTGMPFGLQPTETSNPGAFIRSFKYPSVAIDNNPNINPKANQAVKVFWDTNSANLDF